MAYARSAVAPRTTTTKAYRPQAPKRGFLRRLFDAIEQSNMRRAERDIARFLNGQGRKFTDEAEREIERRFL